MPSPDTAHEIRKSLALAASNESPQDVERLFDILLARRAQMNRSKNFNEKITGALLCFLFPSKPAQYKADMQEFRLSYAGIATNPALQVEFQASILPAALTLDVLEEKDLYDVQWDRGLYFAERAKATGGGMLTTS